MSLDSGARLGAKVWAAPIDPVTCWRGLLPRLHVQSVSISRLRAGTAPQPPEERRSTCPAPDFQSPLFLDSAPRPRRQPRYIENGNMPNLVSANRSNEFRCLASKRRDRPPRPSPYSQFEIGVPITRDRRMLLRRRALFLSSASNGTIPSCSWRATRAPLSASSSSIRRCPRCRCSASGFSTISM